MLLPGDVIGRDSPAEGRLAAHDYPTTFDADSLLFSYQIPSPPPYDWLSICFYSIDKVSIVDLPSPVLVAAFVKELGAAVRSYDVSEGNRLKIEFHGSPWFPSLMESVTMTS